MPDHAASRLPALLRASPHVDTVELSGSRASGTATAFSDWDFVVAANDFGALAAELPALVAAVQPLVQQWDRLSDHACYMLVVDGPTKIDLIFGDVPHEHDDPWIVDAATLPQIDDHLWDWVLWLTSKVAAGKSELVDAELAKMHHHLLAPMGVAAPPASLRDVVDEYVAARDAWCARLGTSVDQRVQQQVVSVVERCRSCSGPHR